PLVRLRDRSLPEAPTDASRGTIPGRCRAYRAGPNHWLPSVPPHAFLLQNWLCTKHNPLVAPDCRRMRKPFACLRHRHTPIELRWAADTPSLGANAPPFAPARLVSGKTQLPPHDLRSTSDSVGPHRTAYPSSRLYTVGEALSR